MATKPRHLKTPMQLWVADNRKRLGLSPRDLAEMTGVTEDTARGWESRGAPSQDAIAILTRRFGEQPPVAGSAGSDTPAGLADLSAAVMALVEELRVDRQERTGLRETVLHNRQQIADLNQAVAELTLRLQRVEAREATPDSAPLVGTGQR